MAQCTKNDETKMESDISENSTEPPRLTDAHLVSTSSEGIRREMAELINNGNWKAVLVRSQDDISNETHEQSTTPEDHGSAVKEMTEMNDKGKCSQVEEEASNATSATSMSTEGQGGFIVVKGKTAVLEEREAKERESASVPKISALEATMDEEETNVIWVAEMAEITSIEDDSMLLVSKEMEQGASSPSFQTEGHGSGILIKGQPEVREDMEAKEGNDIPMMDGAPPVSVSENFEIGENMDQDTESTLCGNNTEDSSTGTAIENLENFNGVKAHTETIDDWQISTEDFGIAILFIGQTEDLDENAQGENLAEIMDNEDDVAVKAIANTSDQGVGSVQLAVNQDLPIANESDGIANVITCQIEELAEAATIPEDDQDIHNSTRGQPSLMEATEIAEVRGSMTRSRQGQEDKDEDHGVQLNKTATVQVKVFKEYPYCPIRNSLKLVLEIGIVVKAIAGQASSLREFWDIEIFHFVMLCLEPDDVCDSPLRQLTEQIHAFETKQRNSFKKYAKTYGFLRMLIPIGNRLVKAKRSTEELLNKFQHCKNVMDEMRSLMVNPKQDDVSLGRAIRDIGVNVMEYLLCRRTHGRDEVADTETAPLEVSEPVLIYDEPHTRRERRRGRKSQFEPEEENEEEIDFFEESLSGAVGGKGPEDLKPNSTGQVAFAPCSPSRAKPYFPRKEIRPPPKVIQPKEWVENLKDFTFNLKDFLEILLEDVDKITHSLSRDREINPLAFPGTGGVGDLLDRARNAYNKDKDKIYPIWPEDEKRKWLANITDICKVYEDCLKDLVKIHELLESEFELFLELWDFLQFYHEN